MNKIKLCIIAPCYNEEEILAHSYSMLSAKLNELIQAQLITEDSRILFVDDGSKDKTWEIIEQLSLENNDCFSLKLSKNFGQQNALIAGFEYVYNFSRNAKSLNIMPFDVAISIDIDLQDDINVISEMIEKFIAGNEIVFGVRKGRDTDTKFKRHTAEVFYKMMSRLGVNVIYNHSEFRLMSTRVLGEFLRYKESKPFIRGIFANIGFKTDKVYYDRLERTAGESKYQFRHLLRLAYEGFASNSKLLLKIPLFIGVMTLFPSLAILAYIVVSYFNHWAVSGWTSLSTIILFFSNIIILILSIIADYIGRIYFEMKERPRYHIDKINDDTSK